MKIAVYLFGFLVSMLCQQTAFAQDHNTTTDLALRPLDEVLEDALAYSPILKLQALDTELLDSELKLLKKEWAQYISLAGSFQVGNVQFRDNLNNSSGEPNINTVSRENVFAVAGINLRIPLSDFLTKKERQTQIKLKVEQNKYAIQDRQLTIRQTVIRQYNDTQRSIALLSIKERDYHFHQIHAEMAERLFKEGSISLSEYTDVHNKYNEAAIRLEDSKLDTQLSLLLLKEVVGQSVLRP